MLGILKMSHIKIKSALLGSLSLPSLVCLHILPVSIPGASRFFTALGCNDPCRKAGFSCQTAIPPSKPLGCGSKC